MSSRWKLGESPGHWSYSGNPSSSNRDEVRFLVGDVDQDDAQMSDEEIEYTLSNESNNHAAAARCCEGLAAYYARKITVSIGGQNQNRTENWGDLYKHYKELGGTLREQAVTLGGTSANGGIYAGGISISDKAAEDADADRVGPVFDMGTLDAS